MKNVNKRARKIEKLADAGKISGKECRAKIRKLAREFIVDSTNLTNFGEV